jgi:hypothetical protein
LTVSNYQRPNLGGPFDKELAEMFGWFNEYTYFGKRKDMIELGKKLNPNIKTWKEYLQSSGLGTKPQQ